MARKDYSQKRWSKEEKGLLRMWMDEHPNAKFYRGTIPQDLAELLPERSSHKIYCAWYGEKMKGKTVTPKQTHTLTKLPVQPYSSGKFDYISRLNDQIGQMVEEQAKARYLPEIVRLKSECEKLQGELEKAKGMLRLTKDIRVAAYKFGKEYAGMNIR